MAVLGAGTWGFPSLFLFLKGNRSRDRATGCLRGWTKIGCSVSPQGGFLASNVFKTSFRAGNWGEGGMGVQFQGCLREAYPFQRLFKWEKEELQVHFVISWASQILSERPKDPMMAIFSRYSLEVRSISFGCKRPQFLENHCNSLQQIGFSIGNNLFSVGKIQQFQQEYHFFLEGSCLSQISECIFCRGSMLIHQGIKLG